MRLTFATEYGCLALLAIGASEPAYCRRQDIVERYRIPVDFLEQVLRKLSAAGIVMARRGSGGGFRLARPATQIAIADIARAIDGPLAPTRSVSENFYFPTPVEESKAFHRLFREVRDAIAAILESTTLEDMLEEERILAAGRRPTRRRARSGPGAATRRRGTGVRP